MSEREDAERIAARAESERLEALALATRARLAALRPTDQGAQAPQAATPGATAGGLVTPPSAAPGTPAPTHDEHAATLHLIVEWGWHGDDGQPAYQSDRIAGWPAQNRARMTHPVYCQDAVGALIRQAIEAERDRAHHLEHALRVYIHAHKTGNSVPPHIEADALALLTHHWEPSE